MPESITEKPCTQCGENKSFSDYSKHNRGKYGLRGICKSCDVVNSKIYRDSHRAEKRAIDKVYKAAHKEQYRAYVRKSTKKRRKKISFKNRVHGESSWQQWLTLLAFYGAKCLCCFRKDYEIDHILAESKGGSSRIDNLQPLCRNCNNRKKARYIDYRPDKGEFARIILTNSL